MSSSWASGTLDASLTGMSTNYERSRTHLSLGKDSPIERPTQSSTTGQVVAMPKVGGLHHRYQRRAA